MDDLSRILTSWDVRYFRLAGYISSWSKDPSTKVGAVLVGRDPRRIAVGYNGFPSGVEDSEDRLSNQETRYKLTQHAERNVLDNATFDAVGAVLFSTQMPCSECAKSIVSRGVSRVVSPSYPDKEPWKSDAWWTVLLFREGGIVFVEISQEQLRRYREDA